MPVNFETKFDSEVVDPSQFRFWQEVLPSDIQILVNRSAWPNYLCYGIVEDALQNEVKMETKDGKEHPRFQEIKDDPLYAELKIAIKNTIGDKRAYGWAYMAVLEFETGKPRVRWFTTGDIKDNGAIAEFEVDKEKAIITKVDFTMRILGNEVKKAFTTEKELEKGILLIKEDAELFVGRSYLEPIFDLLFAVWALYQGLAIFTLRATGGIHMMLMDESVFGDDPASTKTRNDIKSSMDRLGYDTKLLAPASINGVKTEYKLYTGESAVPFAEMDEVLNGGIAGYTGIPLEALKGMPTAFNSSDAHTKKHLRQIEQVQKEAIRLHKFGVKAIWDIDDAEFTIEEFRQLTETEVIDLKTKKLQALATIADKRESLGLKPEDLLTFLDIEDMTVDQAMIAANELRKEEMAKSFGAKDSLDDDDDKPDDD